MQRFFVKCDIFGTENFLQMRHDVCGRHLLEVKLQTAREHRRQHFLRIGSRQNEQHMRRWLLQRFQQRVEGIFREHVYLVNEVDFVTPCSRHVFGIFDQLAHIIHAGIARRVDFEQIHKSPCINLLTGRAHAARSGGHAGFAV